MANIMTQIDILSKNVIRAGTPSVKVVEVWSIFPDDINFEVLYNEEVNFLAHQGGGYKSKNPR